ncbi:Formamidopyrimidine-DNA glycosylase [Serinicoccus hydrothermalis]|uniref:DNA-(apurinic or apyrimidinic site) lyase n=1 Tax=Serinicoccus hydrothermalis TaxID=1758689 RepID=A0A1B1NCJ8_9MICO|nr:DNA-formamidopyrimidine glycosylase family protein [Serinicoccus hydrothermalis]ANS79158.1 Formamidopyrimidine-DNA glycosylase [Serinicoccus hydrothermalis]
MAEGHAVHGMAGRVRRLVGQPGRSSGPVSDVFDPGLLDGLAVADAEAHGKHLLVHLDGTSRSGHFHLGMHGRVSVRHHRRALGADGLPRSHPPVPDGLAWRLLTGSFLLEVTRPTICELLDPEGVARLHARLGPDPLREDADPETAVARLHRSRRPIGLLLLDQSVVSGIGNVYRAELLWRARIDPHSPGNAVPVEALRALWQDAIDLMGIGLGAGWIVTHPDQFRSARDLLVRGEVVPRWPKRYAVYLRRGRPCPRCGLTVVVERMGLQTAYWCPGCQVLHA